MEQICDNRCVINVTIKLIAVDTSFTEHTQFLTITTAAPDFESAVALVRVSGNSFYALP